MGHELSLSDIAALNNGRNYDDGMGMAAMWQNPFIYLVWLAVLGRGGGLFGNDGAGAALTRSDLFEGFNTQDINSQLRSITNGICDGFYAINNGLKDGLYGTQSAIAENRFAAQQCCCGLSRDIDSVRYDMSRGFCDVTGAIHAEGEATRALINANTMQALRDKLEDRDRELMTANFQLSQQAQNARLIEELRPCARPAYITCSPYTTASYCGSCGA